MKSQRLRRKDDNSVNFIAMTKKYKRNNSVLVNNSSTKKHEQVQTNDTSKTISSNKMKYLFFVLLLFLCGIGGLVTYVIINDESNPSSNDNSTDDSSTNECPTNATGLSGWYLNDNSVCLYTSRRRNLFLGSVYRSLENAGVSGTVLEGFNGVYWGIDSEVTHNVLPLSLLNTSCTSSSTHESCLQLFWERTNGGRVFDITNSNGTSASAFIEKRLQRDEGLWGDVTQQPEFASFPDVCDRAINTDEAKRYIRDHPTVLTNLSSDVNVYDSNFTSHRMLCNMIEYPYFPSTTPRGSVDGGRLHNVFRVEIINNRVFYTYQCPQGQGRPLSAHTFQPIYLVLLTKLYKKYIDDIDYDVNMDYSPKNFSLYPDITGIPCVILPNQTLNR